jgi:hypothetical protein
VLVELRGLSGRIVDERYLAMCYSGCCEIGLAFAQRTVGDSFIPVFFLPKHCTLCVVAILAGDVLMEVPAVIGLRLSHFLSVCGTR